MASSTTNNKTETGKDEEKEETLSDDMISADDEKEDDEDEDDEELSVGSPEASQHLTTTTAALRTLRKRKNSDDELDDCEDEKPLDFTQAGKKDYFLPFQKLEMTGNEEEPPLVQPDHNASNNKSKRRGVAGFSIDDILSHKTAALKEKEQQQSQLPIVRPWDIAANHAAAAAAAVAAAQASSAAGGGNGGSHAGHEKNRASKSSKNQGDSSPLDALFQMASKTFEGLKAKSGKSLILTFFFFVQSIKFQLDYEC